MNAGKSITISRNFLDNLDTAIAARRTDSLDENGTADAVIAALTEVRDALDSAIAEASRRSSAPTTSAAAGPEPRD